MCPVNFDRDYPPMVNVNHKDYYRSNRSSLAMGLTLCLLLHKHVMLKLGYIALRILTI